MTQIHDSKTFDPRTAIGGLLSRVKMRMFEELDHELERFDISAAQYVVLKSLANGVDSASGLCKGVSYDPGAMTRMIDRLEKKGLVRRVRCPDDRRVVKLQLSDEGKTVYPKLVATAEEVASRRLKGFSKAEVSQLESYLQRMLAN
jgi:DNA-binding MarR family transcriptional regulator